MAIGILTTPDEVKSSVLGVTLSAALAPNSNFNSDSNSISFPAPIAAAHEGQTPQRASSLFKAQEQHDVPQDPEDMASPKAFVIQRADLESPADSVSLITGGASGIGLQTALLLHSISRNNKIIILDRQAPNINQAPQDFIESERVLLQQCDVASWQSQRAAFEAGMRRFGAIDNVFVNAGITEYQDQFFKDELDVDGKLKEPDRRVLDVDLNAANDTLKLALYHMRHRKGGKKGGNIVMTASLAGYLASAGAPLYSAAKHGIVGLMRALKNDTATLGISLSIAAPGITLTDIVSGRQPGESLTDWAKRMRAVGVPINDPAEVAMTVVWLFGQGMRANGKGMLVQAGKVTDVEEGIAKNREMWMGQEMLDLFRSGRNAPLFPNKL